MPFFRSVPFAVMMLAGCAMSARAEDLVKIEELATGLHNPSGVAVQPETGHVFVADSGVGRVIRVNPADKKVEDVITGFPQDVYGKGPKYNIGPLGLAFRGKNILIVGGGGFPDGEELLRVYDVSDAAKKLDAKDMKQKLGPVAKTETAPGEGNFYQLALSDSALYVTSNGDDTKGWVLRSKIDGDKFAPIERWLATKEALQLDAPVGAAISPMGSLVVGQMGEITVPKDSKLAFFSPISSNLLLSLDADLHDIAALAYGAEGAKGQRLLYALDFAWVKPEEGGLFRLDDNGKEGDERGLVVTKICSLKKPAAMAFSEDGKALYVVVFGDTPGDDAEGEKKTGKLLKITPTENLKDTKGEL